MEDKKSRLKREESVGNASAGETVITIPLADLHPFPKRPFKVRKDASMKETAESVRDVGVLNPAIVRDMDNDTAVIIMADSNLQRENIPTGERAQAYKMNMEAIKRRVGRRLMENDKNGSQLGAHFSGQKSLDIIAEEAGVSRMQIQRHIRLTELSPPLQQMADEKKIALTPAVEISYLKPKEQALLVETIASGQSGPSLSQVQRMRQLSKLLFCA